MLLFYNGQFIDEAMAQERIMIGDVLSAVRKNGHGNIDRVAAVVLEPDASFSVISQPIALDSPLFEDVEQEAVSPGNLPATARQSAEKKPEEKQMYACTEKEGRLYDALE